MTLNNYSQNNPSIYNLFPHESAMTASISDHEVDVVVVRLG